MNYSLLQSQYNSETLFCFRDARSLKTCLMLTQLIQPLLGRIICSYFFRKSGPRRLLRKK